MLWDNELCNSALGVRPLRIHFVDESETNATAEIKRLKSEQDTLQKSQPKALKKLGLSVCYCGFFSMMDGKMMNFLFDNRCASYCPFCKATWSKMMQYLPSIKERISHLQAAPLHALLRGMDCFFELGARNIAGVHKYRNKPSPMTEEEKVYVDMAKEMIEETLAEIGLPYNQIRADKGGKFNDGNLVRKLLGNLENRKKFAEFTGIPLSILTPFYTLYQAVVSRRAKICP